MLLLALDTSTSAITSALYDGSALSVRRRIDVRGHAEWLSSQVAELLAEAGRRPGEVTHVVAGEGPGPFTGLRVGLVTAETFAFATGARYAGVCSLDALAFAAVRSGAVGPGRFVVATDARRKEVYWAQYEAGPGDPVPVRRSEPGVSTPGDLPDEVRALPCVGRGASLYPESLPHAAGPLDVDAGELALLAAELLEQGRLDLRERAQPLYLRRPDAVPSVPPAPSVPSTPSASSVSSGAPGGTRV